MGAGPILDPFSPESQAERAHDQERRTSGLEQRPRVMAPRASMVRPVAAGFGGFWNMAITGAAFAAAYRAEFEEVSHQALFVRLTGLVTDVGTTGEIRVSATLAGNPAVYSAVNAIGSGGVQIPALGWIHNLALSPAGGQLLTIDVEARRTGGAGNLYVFMPVIMQIDPQASSAAGTWYPSGWLPWP